MKIKLLLLLVLLTCATRLRAQHLFVGRGNDLRLLKARIRAISQKGGTGTIRVTFAGGTYRLKEPLRLSGEDLGGYALVLEAAKGGKPVLSGGRELPLPEIDADGNWSFEIPPGLLPQSLFVGGRRAVSARLPASGHLAHILAVKEIKQANGLAEQHIRVATDLQEQLRQVRDWSGAFVHLYHNWDNTVRKVLRYEPDSGIIVITGKPMVAWNPFNTNTRLYIDGLTTAPAPGQWIFRSGHVIYRPLTGEQPAVLRAEVPVLNQVLVLRGVRNVTFRGITFETTVFGLPTEGIDAEQTAASTEAAIMADSVSRVSFEDCEVAHTGLAGIWLRKACTDNQLVRCYLHDLGGSALKIGTPRVATGDTLTARNRIDNNILRDGGHNYPCAAGLVIFQSPYNQVTHNEIADFRYSGISMGWTWGYGNSYSHDNLISYNHIHHLGFGELSDMAGIYNLGKSPGTVISHNTIHHIWSHTYGGWGIYTDEGSSDVLIRDNLVYACRTGGFHQHYGENNMLLNNIFALSPESQLEATRVEKHLSFRFEHNIIYYSGGKLSGIKWDSVRLESDHNLYWDTRSTSLTFGKTAFKDWQQQGKDVHSLIADPGFRDAAHFDFRLKDNRIIDQIGFEPFDYTKAGVYGTQTWKQLALTPPQTITDYEQKILDL